MRRAGVVAVALLVGAGLGSVSGPTFARFTSATGTPANAFSAAADWVGPSASASAIRKAAGGVGGFIKQGGNYFVYANVTDSGNPASGVATVTADVSTITSGQTAVSLASGSWTVDGVAYNRRSAELTADAVLVDGSKSYTLTMTDAGSNSRTQNGFSVIADSVVPAGSDVQTQNGVGGDNGTPEAGDRILYTYTERIEPDSISAGWTGTSTTVTVQVVDNGNNDLVKIYDAANVNQLPLGEINTQGNYVTATAIFGKSGALSTMVQTTTTITVTLGGLLSGTPRNNNLDTMLWTTSSGATDLAGNPCTVSVITELGVNDPDF